MAQDVTGDRLLAAMVRCALLTGIAIFTTLLTYVVLGAPPLRRSKGGGAAVWNVGLFSFVDMAINALCIVLMNSAHTPHYDRLCGSCAGCLQGTVRP